MKILTYVTALLLLSALTVHGGTPDITDHIRSAGHTVIQSEAISALLMRQECEADEPAADGDVTVHTAPTVRAAGFRVQVYSDNNVRTAQSEARSRGRRIQNAFPELRTYVVYNAPYWRLKIGDYGTRSEAEAAAAEIRSTFPAFAKEVRVVRDNINAPVQ